jgi:general secretion pathway protein H
MVRHQSGFTLIELMVVVAIIAVMLAVGVIGLGGRDTQALRQHWAQSQGLIQTACDQAGFQQRLMLIGVEKQTLSVFQSVKGEWVAFDQVKPMSWPEQFAVEFEWDQTLVERLKLPQPGWLCWPEGLISEGAIGLNNEKLSWDDQIQFVFEQEALAK